MELRKHTIHGMPVDVACYGKYSVQIYERIERPNFKSHTHCAICYKETPRAKYGKIKVLWHYVFRDYEAAIKKANEYIGNIKRNIEANEQRKKDTARKNKELDANEYYNIGDIIVNSWGYEQTNIEFYKVTRITKRTIYVREIPKKEAENEWRGAMCSHVIPEPEFFLKDSQEFPLRVNAMGDNTSLSNGKSYMYFHKWDGRPKYCSWYA